MTTLGSSCSSFLALALSDSDSLRFHLPCNIEVSCQLPTRTPICPSTMQYICARFTHSCVFHPTSALRRHFHFLLRLLSTLHASVLLRACDILLAHHAKGHPTIFTCLSSDTSERCNETRPIISPTIKTRFRWCHGTSSPFLLRKSPFPFNSKCCLYKR